MSKSFEECRTLLRPIVRPRAKNVGSVAVLNNRGYAWVVANYLPALERFARGARSREDRRFASDGFYALGDLHDFNEAPLAAMRAYRRSAALHGGSFGAWRELGGMLASIGRFDEARRALERALRIAPDDASARTDLDTLLEMPRFLHRYREGDVLWSACEALARQQPRRALELLGSRRSARARLIRARALGAQGDVEGVVQEWQGLARTRGTVVLSWGDWFFLPMDARRRAELWEAISALGERLGSGVFENLSSLPAQDAGHDAFVSNCLLTARFHAARIRKDLRAARALLREHPEWQAAAALVERLERS